MAFLKVNCFSNVLRKSVEFNVILPEKIGKEEFVLHTTFKTYPVLYLLHGMTDDYMTWMRKTSIERYVEEKELIVVMPDGDLSWYTNTEYEAQYKKYIAEELPYICKEFFPQISIKREETFIAGNSMGGYGAFSIALTYPEKYGYAVGLSSAFSIETVMQNDIVGKIPTAYWKGIFGDDIEKSESENDIVYLAEKLIRGEKSKNDLPQFYAACGMEDILFESQREVIMKMEKMGYNTTYYERDGKHDWEFWDNEIKKVLHWLPIRENV